MAEPITIPISIFEVTIDYERPALRIWPERSASIAQQVFEALMPWNPGVDDIEIRHTGKLSEQGISLRLPAKLASFFFGLSYCRFTQEAASWETAQETLHIISTVLNVIANSGVVLAAKKAALSLHLQPRRAKFVDLLGPFVPSQLAALDHRPIGTMASVVKWESRKVTLDGSGLIANAIFLRLDRDFDASVSVEDVARQLRKDEEELFKILSVEEVRG
ncbi:MAG: hypothetical protein KGN84_14135 [Acidobacteriota bacterium]|nr:hypothetical protein [Acidobacteriota bacterium]